MSIALQIIVFFLRKEYQLVQCHCLQILLGYAVTKKVQINELGENSLLITIIRYQLVGLGKYDDVLAVALAF